MFCGLDRPQIGPHVMRSDQAKHETTTAPYAARMKLDRRQRGFVVAASAALIFVGTLLPWASAQAPFVGTVRVKMTSSGGDWMFFMGLAAAAAVIAWKLLSDDGRLRWLTLAAGIVGVVTGLLLFIEMAEIDSRMQRATDTSELVSTSYEPGIFVVGLGAAVLMFAGFVAGSADELAPTSEITW